jgi:predicted nucleic acid-binding protein
MTTPFIDTDVIVRLLTGDDPEKQAASAALFEQVQAGTLQVAAPDTVIADAVYVLSSPRLYNLPRSEVRELLTPLVRLKGFKVKNRRVVLKALDLYGSMNIDFGDAFIAASMEQAGSKIVYSYDTDFDGIAGIERIEPSTGDYKRYR